MIFRICFSVMTLFLVLFCSSCGKSAPPPPRMRLELVLDIFDTLQRGDYNGALAKIERLRELDKTNVFVSELENVERANLKLKEAEAALLKNQHVQAENLIREAIRMIGPVPSLVQAQEDMNNFSQLSFLAERIAAPVSSAQLISDLEAFRKGAKKFKNNQKLLAFAEKRDKMIDILKSREDRITYYDLCADGLAFEKNATSIFNTVEAQKEIEQKLLR